MEQQAQNDITGCKGKEPVPNMGKNIMWWTGTSFNNPAGTINSTLSNWWGTAKKVGVDSENRYTDSGLYYFSNMVFYKTTKIGCAYEVCDEELTFTCLYDQAGYFTNAMMWETGEACSADSDCTTFEPRAHSTCDNGLCIKGPDIPEPNEMCPENEGMSDWAREKYLDLHNSYRSSVARGLEPDGLGGYAPKAAKMQKMVYDCALEATALRQAKKCVYEHSKIRPGFGENIFANSWLNLDKIEVAKQSSGTWWRELKKHGVGPENILKRDMVSKIGHYSQMAWDATYRLGCGVAHCPTMTFAVCQYGPAGNYPDSPIYTIGEPCSGCSRSDACSATEGLCIAA